VPQPIYRVPATARDLVPRLLCPSPLPSGWCWSSSQVGQHELKALYRNTADRVVASLTLVHPSLAAPNFPRTERFALLLQVTRQVPSASALLEALTASVRANEGDFAWDEYQLVEQRLPPPGGRMDPARARSGPPDERSSRSGWEPLDPVAEREIDEHLELVPWIDLDLAFDHQAMFAEAMALAHRFVVYRSDPRYNPQGWKGLALWAIDGDAEKAAMPEGTLANREERYAMTDVAPLCPRTMALLSELLDFEHARAIAFLMLEPRSRVEPHCDDTMHEVMRSVNVALNMPAGCEFVIETAPGGAHTPFTRTIPFRAGSAMVLNVAREHYLVNRSDEPRIHIVARAPLKWPASRLVARARAQNGLATAAEVRGALDEKYRQRGLPVPPADDSTRYVRKPKHPEPPATTPSG